MQDPAGNLDQLSHLVSVQDDHGEPMRSSGAFAVVFKMKDESTGKEYALKCFTEDQEGRAEAYRQIADELESVDSTYVTSVKYLEKELFVDCDGDDHEFPVLLMDWIEGETMDRYIAENLYDNYAMSMLCYRFCKMAAWLRSQPFAHGDIKPDNIMVRPDGSLTLIDYDGMFVPAMKGQTSPTIGTKDFSHPLRTKDDFDETIDDFALATIALSLKAISLSPSLFDEYGSTDRLLFSADDYRDLSQSKLLTALQPLMTDSELNTLLSLFLLAHATKTLSMVSFRLFSVSEPEYVPVVDISTEVTEEDLVEAIEDEYGVKYSKDRKRLLKAPQNIKGEYCIRKGTICICDDAFSYCSYLTRVIIPDNVTKIGDDAFYHCYGLTDATDEDLAEAIEDEYGVKYSKDGKRLLKTNNRLSGEYRVREGTICICNYAFAGLAYSENSHCIVPCGNDNLTGVLIPDGVSVIGPGAFYGCKGLTSIVIPVGVTIIESETFKLCSGLTSIVIPNTVTKIESSAFEHCSGFTSIKISDSVTKIESFAFEHCSGFTSLKIPDSVTEIESCAFRGCQHLANIEMPNSVMEIGTGAFYGCNLLDSVKKELTEKFGNDIFYNPWWL